MGYKLLLALILILVISTSLFFYLAPFKISNLAMKPGNSNFSLIEPGSEMQFYPNLRFPSNEISYKISGCTLRKEDDMESAFDWVSNATSLKFNPVLEHEEISVFCEEKNKYDSGLFIAGEGGPVNITVAGNFNVITKGEILLIKPSSCPKSNIAVHELLHVLGFNHSTNKNNIMYPITDCDQELSADIITLIDNLYSSPSEPDLILQNITGKIEGRFLEINLSVINGGFKNAGDSKLLIYSEDKVISEIELPAINIGYGRVVHSENIWLPYANVEQLKLVVEADFKEISKENNLAELEIAK